MIPGVSGRSRKTKHVTPPNDWVYIVSSALNSLPSPGTRVGTGDAANMPTIRASASGGTPAIQTASGARKFRLVGLNIEAHASGNTAIVQLGGGETTLGAFPSDVIIDRCIVKGAAAANTVRGVALDVIRGAVVDSYIYNILHTGADAQAVWCYNTPGPVKVVNNYLEATGENMMTGGADPAYADSVPSDIEIRRNYFKKQSYAAWVTTGGYSVKNILEFKNAQRVLVEGNVFETNYVAGQTGFSWVVTPRNQNGGASWCVTQDITFRYNKMTDVDSGINILGTDNNYTSQNTARLDFQHNFILCNNSSTSNLKLMQLVGTAGNNSIKLVHNTMLFADGAGNTMAQIGDYTGMTGFVWRDNLVSRGQYGFRSDSQSEGTNTITTYFSTPDFTYNVKVGTGGTYPATNQTAADYAAVSFTNSGAGDYSLAGGSSFKGGASDATDPGADWTTLNSKTAHAIDGAWGTEHATYTTEATVNAELPRTYIDTTYRAQSGTTWNCTTAAEFTTALAGCAFGDTIVLTAGNTFTGSFTLRSIS